MLLPPGEIIVIASASEAISTLLDTPADRRSLKTVDLVESIG